MNKKLHVFCLLLLSCTTLMTLTSCISSTRSTAQTSQTATQGQLTQYDCTRSYISNDRSYGHYTESGGCQNGIAFMEMTDHRGTAFEALDYCTRKGMRLPTFHELSAAGKFAQQLQLSEGNYWASSVTGPGTTNQYCAIPTGKCGTHNPKDTLYYRCVQY